MTVIPSTQIILPRILQVGGGASAELVSVLGSLNCQRPLIVTDVMMVKLGYVARIANRLCRCVFSAVYLGVIGYFFGDRG